MLKQQFKDIQKTIIDTKYGFSEVYKDTENLHSIKNIVNANKDKYQNIVILGIGGSSLGPKCLQDIFYNYRPDRNKRFIVLDNIEPDYLASWSRDLDLQQTLFLVISKSGGTPETLAQFWYFQDQVTKQQLDIDQHFWFITDPENGFLRKYGTQNNIKTFDIPSSNGGRFSVLTNVGLVFAEFMGLDTEQLLAGAGNSYAQFCNANEETCNPYILAKLQYENGQDGRNINVIMPYSTRLKSFGDWYVQLLSESIGKKHDRAGNIINVGLTPHGAVGVSDQHSQLQLFAEGPKDKLIIFIEVQNFENSLSIPAPSPSQIEYLADLKFADLLHAEFQATRQSLVEAGQICTTITLEKISEYNIGGLFMDMMLSVAILGEMYDINAFDQPGVERSKILTKEFLK